MNKFWLITKINLRNFFDFNKKSEKKSLKIILLVGILAYLLFYVYEMANFMVPGFMALNMPYHLLGYFFAILSIFILVANALKIKNILFDFKDYDLLMSLPIKKNLVIMSKLIALYVLNLIYTLIVMVPVYVAFIGHHSLNTFLYFPLLLVIPIAPLLISVLLGIFIAWLTTFFKNKTLGNYLVNISIIVVAFVVSFSMNFNSNIDMAQSGLNFINKTNGIYPLTIIFINLFAHFTFLELLIFLMVPLVLTGLFIFIISKTYAKVRTNLLKVNVNSNYQVKNYKENNALTSLYKKELKKYFSNSMYFLNTAFGCIMLIILCVCLFFFNVDKIANIMEIEDLASIIDNYAIYIVSMLCIMSCTTNSSISLEGKSFWIMKMLPVKLDTIFLSKIMVNLTILLPTILIGSTFFGIYLHLDAMNFVFLYVIPILFAIFTSVLGLILNLLFPKFDFDNEIKVIKQSMPVFLSMIIGIIVVALVIASQLNRIIVIFMLLLVDIILTYVLHQYGQRRVKEL